LRHAIRLEPESVNSLNLAAWTLATTPGSPGDATEAVALAERARALSTDPWVLTSLAAAYGAAGRAPDAMAITTALRPASEDDPDLAELLGAMEAAFTAGRPYRAPPPGQ
jgi:hypothetical protein